MKKTIKRILFSSLSVLGISTMVWIVLFLNPKFSYAHQTVIDNVTIFHNLELEDNSKFVVKNAISRLKKSELFNNETRIQLCLNDDKLYPNLQPLVNYALAYAVLDKTIVKDCNLNFKENIVETKWDVNNFEYRKFDLTYLLAHEFTHNLQFEAGYMPFDPRVIIDWRLEGYADYIGRDFKEDGKLLERIDKYLTIENNEFIGFPVLELEDGTKQIFSYFKYSLVVQYLIEIKDLNFEQIMELDSKIESYYLDMIEWKNENDR